MRSLDHICSVELFGCASPAAATVLIELPHGATEGEHYNELAAQMSSQLPERLIEFFYVNTDVGTPELGWAVAEALKELGVVLLRCLIPRTLIDCNRVIDAAPEDYKSGGVTPGIPEYITDSEDRQLLLGRHSAYIQMADQLMEEICGRGGMALILHSYAPRSVGIQSVGADIVSQLHRAYQPEMLKDWPLRPVFDCISRSPEGDLVTDTRWIQALQAALLKGGLPEAASGETYPLHPVTTAHRFATKHAPRVLCLEVRRDWLVGDFVPFVPLRACPSQVASIAAPIAEAALSYWKH